MNVIDSVRNRGARSPRLHSSPPVDPAAPGRLGKRARVVHTAATNERHLNTTREPRAEIRRLAVAMVKVLGPYVEIRVGVPDDEVGVETRRDRALPTLDPGEARRRSAHPPRE